MTSTLRCLQVLDLLAAPPYSLALADIAAALALPPASAHRLARTLCASGYAEQDPESRRYRLAGKALWAGAGYLRRSPVYQAAFLPMQETARAVEGLVHLGAIDNGWLLYLHTVGSPSALYLYADTGERRHLHSTGLGKALLAFQPPAVLSRLLTKKLPRFTPQTITDPAALRAELARIRAAGYAVDNEEGAAGLCCLAAPVFDQNNQAVAALSVSAPAATLTHAVRRRWLPVLLQAALRVSVQLGHRPAGGAALFTAAAAAPAPPAPGRSEKSSPAPALRYKTTAAGRDFPTPRPSKK
jgi:DNA-binding IclR family transcriptional regulator